MNTIPGAVDEVLVPLESVPPLPEYQTLTERDNFGRTPEQLQIAHAKWIISIVDKILFMFDNGGIERTGEGWTYKEHVLSTYLRSSNSSNEQEWREKLTGGEPVFDLSGEHLELIEWDILKPHTRDLWPLFDALVSRGYLGRAYIGKHIPEDVRQAIINEHDEYEKDRQAAEAKRDVDRQINLAEFEEYRRQRGRQRAQERIQREDSAQLDLPRPLTLRALLDKNPDPITYRVQDLWPLGGRVVLAAKRKSGKTTLVGNLVRSLVDGTPFLGQFEVQRAGVVGVIDLEMSQAQLTQWYRDLNIREMDNVLMLQMRGQATALDMRVPETRQRWAELLKEHRVEVLIIDCLAPLLNALGVDEDKNTQVGPVLTGIDELLREAGITDCVLVHHMGHGAERSRGASRLRDWPEVEWKLTKNPNAAGTDDDDRGPRFFEAFGRDVDTGEATALEFRSDTRTLQLPNAGERRTRAEVAKDRGDQRLEAAALEATEIVLRSENRELNTGDIQARMVSTSNRTIQSRAIQEAVSKGLLVRKKSGVAYFHVPGPASASIQWGVNATSGAA